MNRYWLIETNKTIRLILSDSMYAADLSIPDEEVILGREEIFEDDCELFDCEVYE